MKKGITLALALLLVVTLVSAVTGCSSGDKQAKQYMQKGDVLLEDVQSKAEAWNAQVKAIGADPATIAAQVEQARIAGDELIAVSQAAKVEYEKIKAMDGVAVYKEYADLRIGELDSIQQIVTKTYDFLGKRVAMVVSKDLSFYPPLQQEYQDAIEPLSENGQKLEQDAEKLKSEKKL